MTYFLEKGYLFEGPDGMSYVLTRDVAAGDPIRSSDFLARGGAPKPVAGVAMPIWLSDFIKMGAQ